VPNRGSLPVSASFDTIGPMARHVGDLARVLAAIEGPDPDDPISADFPPRRDLLRLDPDVRRMRIGVPRNFYFDNLDPEVARAVRSLAETLARSGAEVVDVTVEGAEAAHQAATVFIYADACALHARALDERRADISSPVYDRMIQGRSFTAVQYAEAMRFREAWRRTFRRLFDRVDVLLTPASPYPAGPIDDGATLHEATRHATRFSYGGGLAGIPGLALPCGLSSSGLPIGAQLEAAWGREDLLLRAGLAWQDASDWHERRPPVD
jgi:aspartyl-tRNA(Asn)/glutamyl-tRNA(Gln) amidotransferase subunit A